MLLVLHAGVPPWAQLCHVRQFTGQLFQFTGQLTQLTGQLTAWTVACQKCALADKRHIWLCCCAANVREAMTKPVGSPGLP